MEQVQLYFADFIRWQEHLSWSQAGAFMLFLFAISTFLLAIFLGDKNAQDIDSAIGRDSLDRDYKKRP